MLLGNTELLRHCPAHIHHVDPGQGKTVGLILWLLDSVSPCFEWSGTEGLEGQDGSPQGEKPSQPHKKF